LNAFALIAVLMVGSFAVFPYLSAYLVANVGMTEDQLPIVYIVGGGLTLFTAPWIGKLADRHGKLTVYRWIAPISALCFVLITQLPTGRLAFAVAVFGALMVVNSGRMIAAMAMVTSSVEPHRRGGFLSANSSMQHVSSGFGAYLGGLIIEQVNGGRMSYFGAVGWLAGAATLLSLWLAGRIRMAHEITPSHVDLSLAAAAEASFDVGEPLVH
jgi:predicted MFS family arabinose efflux permease